MRDSLLGLDACAGAIMQDPHNSGSAPRIQSCDRYGRIPLVSCVISKKSQQRTASFLVRCRFGVAGGRLWRKAAVRRHVLLGTNGSGISGASNPLTTQRVFHAACTPIKTNARRTTLGRFPLILSRLSAFVSFFRLLPTFLTAFFTALAYCRISSRCNVLRSPNLPRPVRGPQRDPAPFSLWLSSPYPAPPSEAVTSKEPGH